MLLHNRKRKTCLVVWLAIAQAFVAHAVVPGLTLRPPAAQARPSSARGHDVEIANLALDSAWRETTIRRAGNSSGEDDARHPGRGGRPDRCRAFFIAYKATVAKGSFDCLVIGLADLLGPLDATTFRPDVVFGPSLSADPTAAFTSLTILLCRPRC